MTLLRIAQWLRKHGQDVSLTDTSVLVLDWYVSANDPRRVAQYNVVEITTFAEARTFMGY